MAKDLREGFFITFEGPEGSGKSTHSHRLLEDLLSEGYDAVRTVEPGGTLLGQKIRNILLERDDIRLDKTAELFLFEADRAQHVEEHIRPLLEQRKIVICDRFNTATFAYQGYGLGMGMDLIRVIDDTATGGLSPDLTILMDVNVETGLIRAQKTGPADRMEKRKTEFHKKVRAGYLSLAGMFPDVIKIIKVHGDIDETYDLVRNTVYGFIERHTGAE